jgi:hypothetical protein
MSLITDLLDKYIPSDLQLQFTSVQVNECSNEVTLGGEYEGIPISAKMSLDEFKTKASALEVDERLEFEEFTLQVGDKVKTLKAWTSYTQVKAGLDFLAS